MGQKVHPLGFRVGITKKHQSQWFVRFHKHKYAQTVLEDRMLRETLTNLFPQLLNPIWKMPQKKRDSQDELSIAPKITKIKIERGLIPYEIVIQIHAENCNLIKTSIENLKVNRDLLCQLQKMRRYLQHLRGKCPKLNNFSLISSLSSINQSNTKPNAENKIINKKESKNFVLGTLQNSKISPSLALALALCPPKGGLGQGPATPFSPKPPFGGQGTEKRSVALSPQRGQGFGQPFPSLPSGVKKGDARLSRRGGFATAMAIKKTNESFWKMPSSKLILSKARQKRYLTKYELRHQRFLLKRLKKRQSIRRRYVDFVGKNLFLTKKDNFLKIILLSPKLSFSLLQSAIKNKDKGNFLGNLQKKALLPLLKKQFLKNLTLRSTTQRAKANSFKSERGNVSNQSNQKVVTASNPEGLKKQQTNSQNKMSPLALTLDSSGQGPATLSPSLRILTPKGLGKGVKKGGKVKRSAALSPRRGQGLGQPVARRAKTANIFQTRIKKKFLSIFINRMNNKFLQNLKILLRSFVSSTLNTSFPNQTNSVLAPLVGVNNPFPNPEGAASLRDDKGFKAENVDSFPFSKATESLKFSKRSINVLKSNLNTLRSASEATQKAKAEKKGKFKEIKTENLISSGTISKKNSFTFDVPNPLPVTSVPLRGKGSEEGGLRASAYQRDQRVQNRFLKKHNLFKNLLFTSTFGLQPTGQRGRQYQYKVLSQLNKFMFILEEKAFKKMEILRKNFITFASIPKTEAYNYYEILILLKQVKELISKIKRKNKISLAFAPFDLQPYPPKKAVSANSEGAIFSLARSATPALYVTPFESEEGVQQRLPITGQKFSDLGLLQDKSNLDNRSMSVFERIQKQADNNKDTNQSYLDNLLIDDNNLKSIKFNLLFKKLNNIDNECRKIKFIEYLKGIVKKHRNNNIYLYLSTISDARKDLRKLQQFTKRNASFLFGLNTNQNEESLLALPLSPPSSLPFLSEAARYPEGVKGLGSGVTGKGPATLAPEGGIGEGPQAKELAKTQMTERISNVLYQMNKKSFHLTYSCNLLSSTNTNLVDSNKTLCEVFLEQIEKQRKMLKHNTELIPKIAIKFYSVNAKTVKAKASVVADSIVDALEKRKAFRKVIKDAKEELMRTPGVKGVKIQVAGRLNGAEIARSEWVRAGRVPLQTLRANLDYCYKTASTIYGIIGIKVWVFKGYTKLL